MSTLARLARLGLAAAPALLVACTHETAPTASAAGQPFTFEIALEDGRAMTLDVQGERALERGVLRYDLRFGGEALSLVVGRSEDLEFRQLLDAEGAPLGTAELDAAGWLRAENAEGDFAATFPARLDDAAVAALLPETARVLLDDAVVSRIEDGPAAGVETAVSPLRIGGGTRNCCTYPNGAGTCCCYDAPASCGVSDGATWCFCGVLPGGGGKKLL